MNISFLPVILYQFLHLSFQALVLLIFWEFCLDEALKKLFLHRSVFFQVRQNFQIPRLDPLIKACISQGQPSTALVAEISRFTD